MSLSELLKKFTVHPAGILGLEKGTLRPGSAADITIIDLSASRTVDVSKFESKSRNSPFNGWELPGKVVYTIVGGKVVRDTNGLVDG